MDFSVIVDTREQRPLRFKDVNVIHRALKSGDYSIQGPDGESFEDRISIERKSLDDLLSSITHRREYFDANMERLLKLRSRALLVECLPNHLERGAWFPKVHPNSVIGTLFKWKMRGVPVIYAVNQEQASKYVLWFLRLFWERKDEFNGLPQERIEWTEK